MVRYRIDGVLRDVSRLDPQTFPAISTRIKIMANLNIMERRLPQDGRITVHLGDDRVDLRVSVSPPAARRPGIHRAAAVQPQGHPPEPGPARAARARPQRLQAAARQPNGLILVTGPTGSGKTTTLNAALQRIRSRHAKDHHHRGPDRVPGRRGQPDPDQREIGLTFDSMLRRVLRQDPNVIMVGEIRDTPTAELAVRAALTGHLVLSTLHTRDAVSVITRLRNMGIEAYLIAAVLRRCWPSGWCAGCAPTAGRRCTPSAAERELLARHGLPPGPSVPRAVAAGACHEMGLPRPDRPVRVCLLSEGARWRR